jgi:hypothetical protein
MKIVRIPRHVRSWWGRSRFGERSTPGRIVLTTAKNVGRFRCCNGFGPVGRRMLRRNGRKTEKKTKTRRRICQDLYTPGRTSRCYPNVYHSLGIWVVLTPDDSGKCRFYLKSLCFLPHSLFLCIDPRSVHGSIQSQSAFCLGTMARNKKERTTFSYNHRDLVSYKMYSTIDSRWTVQRTIWLIQLLAFIQQSCLFLD